MTGCRKPLHDAQHTGYTPEEPVGPWSYAWSWNGSDAQGKETGNFYDGPRRDARTVTGHGRIYVPSGAQGFYALNVHTGDELWHFEPAAVSATPAYDAASDSLFAPASDGTVYKLNADTGAVLGTFDTQQAIARPLLLAENTLFVVTTDGQLFSIDANRMQPNWVYASGAAGSTPAAYSALHKLVVYGTGDLYVQAVDAATGTLRWKVKPTPRTTDEMCGMYNYDYRWPVIADAAGIVFMRLRNPWNAESAGQDNAEVQQYLIAHPELQSLFALNLTDGSPKFIPNIAPDGSDQRPTCNGATALFHAISAAPVVKTLPEGKQVAYIPFRTNQPPYDSRWDATMGEMVLDDDTVPGYKAGELRFIQFASEIPTNMITDEIHTISMAGSTIFHHHVFDVQSYTILDRSPDLGSSFAAMIPTRANPLIVRWWNLLNGEPSNPDAATHFGNPVETGDRYYGEAFWIYQGALQKEMVFNPDLPPLGGEEGSANRYVYVSNGMIIVQGPRGDLFALRHS
ncbi:MAG: PQQ-binding-like beta-propeller repeat protein [Anaerolineae bacterium]